MNQIQLSYLFIATALISTVISLMALINRKNSANKAMSLLMGSVSVWSLFYGLELSVNNIEAMQFFIKLEYIGISTIPVFWLIFASMYCGKDSWLNFQNVIFLFVVPAITLITVTTNHSHHLFYISSNLVQNNGSFYHEFVSGPFYWLHIFYSYSVIFVGLIIVISTIFRVSKDNRSRVILILVSTIIPYFFSFAYILGLRPDGNIDLTPLGFLIMGILVMTGTFNKGLLNIKPFVLNSLYESIPDAILVTDINNELISTNPKANIMIKSGELTAEHIKSIILSNDFSTDFDNDVPVLEIETTEKTYRVEKSLISKSNNQQIGTMFLIVDITQEKKYRLALKQSEEQYRLLFENAQEAIVVVQDKTLAFNNPMLCTMSEYTSDELLNIHISQLVHFDDLYKIHQIYEQVAQNLEPDQKLQFRLVKKSGSLLWVEFSSVIIQWNNKPAGLLFVKDINQQKQNEELKELLIKISNKYINADINEFEGTLNDSLREMGEFVNADRSYVFEYNWEKNTCSNTFEWCAEGVSHEIENLQDVPLELLPDWVDTHKNNKPMYVDNVSALELDSSLREILEPQGILSLFTVPMMDGNKCIGFVGFDFVKTFHISTSKEKDLLQVFSQMLVNLSNRKKANDFLQNQLKVQNLINTISSDLVSVDSASLDDKIKRILQQTGEFFNVDRSYILRYSNNTTIETNTHEWCANGILSQKDSIINVNINQFPWWKSQVQKKEIIYIKDTALLPDEFEVERLEFERQGIKTLLCFPILNNNNLLGFFGFDTVCEKRNWTDLQIEVIETLSNILGDALIKVETEVELIRSKELAEAASVAKSNFLSNMSHEIRTPLNGVIGFTELLRNTKLDKSQTDYLDNAITSANSLLGVISDILDFSKIESGKMEIESIKTDIIQLFENSSDIVKVMAANKGLELLLDIHPEIPRFAYIDPIRTKQILVNLLSNAVKFTHKGEIELSLSFVKTAESAGIYKVKVRDTGIGIKNEDRSKLFKAFSQADTSTTRRYGGTGLGLIISNSLAQQMGGSIEFESEYGVGTSFYFNINCKCEYGEIPDYKNIRNLKNVLVIDDNANNRAILEHSFRFWEINFTGVESGFDALNLLQKGMHFDLIIVDYHMPEIDGIETIEKIREILSDENGRQPVIMLHSSSDDLSLHEKANKLNVRFLLTKPVKHDELYYYLNNICGADNEKLSADYRSQSFEVKETLNVESNLSILIAEDTPMNLILISKMLKAIIPALKIYEASNGIEAIQLVKKNKLDMILMDVQMPEMDGLEATKQIRHIANGRSIPIIALTAGVSKEERELCFKSGMDDFLSKPIEKTELNKIISKYFIEVSQKSINNDQEIAFEIQEIDFDKDKLLSKIGSEEVLVNLLTISISEYPKYIVEINEAIKSADIQQIKLKAHKLKGSALNMEFISMGKIAGIIENNADNTVLCTQLCNKLEQIWVKLSNEFNIQ